MGLPFTEPLCGAAAPVLFVTAFRWSASGMSLSVLDRGHVMKFPKCLCEIRLRGKPGERGDVGDGVIGMCEKMTCRFHPFPI